jgi:maltose alpha-D-glucosyltransferase/alpha-amylase
MNELTPRPAAVQAARSLRADGIINRNDVQWYRDAVIYQLHVKAFQDANNDGVGDFAGLMQRLDHVQDLGVTAIWLLPFYPSPLRDDGYDIADYRAINPSYGTMREFKAFVAEAHRRGLRVITELVINHTSDQHPWFQRARRAKPGSAARNFYVWSDTDSKFPETRIIFTDTETSNWTWDPVAGAFFWHRFYSHQPDLNFDNPRVLQEVLKVMRMWLDMGVDGLRLDAIPYLIEREGTNNENLPETHEVLKKIRRELDAHYSDRMLLAEANQWPEDTRPYFGEGDECHMGFHFPLMPRMYMALAQEDRHPITDIIRQTPDIPEGCQWGIFLRNHDELTLEMVTDQERDYLWRTYAEDRRARINLGIRRRLAPLLQNDRRKIELMNSLLMSMPGTPIVYYGDEIGMGDNYYLGDRDGVRTPMQWSANRNADFSKVNPQQLYLPAIQDPIYGYQAINVETQQGDPSSLLNWMRRMITVRKQHRAFGRGSMTLLYPRNRKILAYVREYEGERILCVANLSRAAQAVEIDLSRFKGAVPIELSGYSPFPPIGDLPYLVTLPAFGFFWFLLTEDAEAPRWHEQMPDMLPEFITMTTRDGSLITALSGREKQQLESQVLPQFLPLQRWFGAKDHAIGSVKMTPLAELQRGEHALVVLDVEVAGDTQRYFLPISARWGEENLQMGAPKLSYTLAKVRRGPRVGALVDGVFDEFFAGALLTALRDGGTLDAADGTIVFGGSDLLAGIADFGEPRPLTVEQSNVSIAYGDQAILKLYRRLRTGEQPDVEVARFLTEVTNFPNTPAFLGAIEHRPQSGDPTTLAAAFAFVPNQGDAWSVLTDALAIDLDEHALGFEDGGNTELLSDDFVHWLGMGELFGRRTAELHDALATATDNPDFGCTPLSRGDVDGWVEDAVRETELVLDRLEERSSELGEEAKELASDLLSRRRQLLDRLRLAGGIEPSGGMSRIHGDYHMGQILVAQDDLMIIDFEGEPKRSLAERRAKSSPLRDVAGMLRSIDYVAATVLNRRREAMGSVADSTRARAELWRKTFTEHFLAGYEAGIAGSPSYPGDPDFARALTSLFLLQKAVYEIGYELANRPAWVEVPLRGIQQLLSTEDSV